MLHRATRRLKRDMTYCQDVHAAVHAVILHPSSASTDSAPEPPIIRLIALGATDVRPNRSRSLGSKGPSCRWVMASHLPDWQAYTLRNAVRSRNSRFCS